MKQDLARTAARRRRSRCRRWPSSRSRSSTSAARTPTRRRRPSTSRSRRTASRSCRSNTTASRPRSRPWSKPRRSPGTWSKSSRPTSRAAATKACSRSSTTAKIGNKADFVPAAVTECGVGIFVWSTVMAYNGDKLKTAPTTWADFWDVKKFPGKRGMRKGARYNLEFALMADGVQAGRRLQGAGHQGRRRSRVQEADRAQAEHPVVGSRRAAAAVPGGRRRRHEHRLQRPHRRRQPRRQEPEDHLDRRHLRPRLLDHPEGHAQQGRGA